MYPCNVVSAPLSHSQVRSQFPALGSGFAFLENAGGSQLPSCVINAMTSFLRESYVQTTAGYPASDRATQTGTDAHAVVATLMGAGDKGTVVLGPSTTQLMVTLASCYAQTIVPGDEIIVSIANHEANAGPWAKLDRVGASVKWWGIDNESGDMSLGELEKLLTPRTRIVAFPHTSNLLGNIVDVAAVTELCHAYGARVVVDGVAYAPHALIEAAKWNVDYYAFSHYKVYGPHMAALYADHQSLSELEGPNHFFIDPSDVPHVFELGCLSWEGCAGVVALGDYLKAMTGHTSFNRQTVERATDMMREWERPLMKRFLEFLLSKPTVRLVGPTSLERVPTFSFLTSKHSSSFVAAEVNRQNMGVRNGHMYSHRLTEALGVSTVEGFVRVSAVHYNSVEEIDRVCEVLDPLI